MFFFPVFRYAPGRPPGCHPSCQSSDRMAKGPGGNNYPVDKTKLKPGKSLEYFYIFWVDIDLSINIQVFE